MFSSARSGSRNSRALSGTLAVACLLSVLVASPCPAQPAVGPAVGPVSESRNEKVRGFIDKWVLNGGNIGGAIGAVAGQALGTALFPGPTAMVLGSFVGNQIGQIIGEYTDNKVGEAYNYAAFNRPGLGQDGGGFILPNAGPYEQAFYQLDRWVISGGFLASMGMHFGLNYLGRVVPGGQILLRPLTMIIADYVAGSIGDNIDGLIDLGEIGRRIDVAKGLSPHPPAVTGPAAPVPSIHGGPVARSFDREATNKAYQDLMSAVKSGNAAAIRTAHERYLKLGGRPVASPKR